MMSEIRVLALVPSYFGYDGLAVNERQLLEAFSHKVSRLYVVSLVGFKQLFSNRRSELKISRPNNVVVIPVPIPEPNHLALLMMSFVISAFSAVIALVLKKIWKTSLVYIRTSWLAPGFMFAESLRSITIVKITAIIEDEIPNNDGLSEIVKKLSPTFDRLVITQCKRVAVPSPVLGEILVKKRGFKPKKPWLIIPPGVNLAFINLLKNSKNVHKKNGAIWLGFIGSLAWWQGVNKLVKAVAIVKNKIKNVKLIIIGDGAEKDKIVKACRELSVDYEITGLIPHDEALQYLMDFDAMVLPRLKTPTTEANIPIKVIEAWALGIPVIITPHKVLLDMCKDREDILYAEPTPEDIANKIILLLSDRKLREMLSKRGPMIAKNFDYNAIADALIKSLGNHYLKGE